MAQLSFVVVAVAFAAVVDAVFVVVAADVVAFVLLQYALQHLIAL